MSKHILARYIDRFDYNVTFVTYMQCADKFFGVQK